MSSIIGDRMNEIAQTIERKLDGDLTPLVLGEGLQAWSKKVSPDGERVTVGALVHLALLNDALVIAEEAVMHDGVITAEEKAYVTPLARVAVQYLVHFRLYYEEFKEGLDDVKDFLDTHMSDASPFGGKCAETRWTGARICRNFAINDGDRDPLDRYRETMVTLVEDIFELTKGSSPEASAALCAEIERNSRLERTDAIDSRIAAFCARTSTNVFHAVAHANEVFERDPLDVEAIHADARDAFARVLGRATAIHRPSRHGLMLLVKGESGAGKTHLMRAFRNYVHEKRLGHVGYLQMTSAHGSYARHVLSSLIDSLEHPFLQGERSSLTTIADSLMRWRVPAILAERLREEADVAARNVIVGQIADHLVTQPEFEQLDVNLLSAFILLASNDGVVAARVKRYLRCDSLSDYDRQLLGGIAPAIDDNAPLRMIAGIGRLIAASHGGALVLLVDQLEDIYDKDGARGRFRQLMDVLRQITELVPASVAVVASLGDFYERLRDELARPLLDRLENDPPPVRIVEGRSAEEVDLLVSTRLRALFESHGARPRDDQAIWPFEAAQINALAGLRTRDVLAWCLEAHERCVAAGKLVAFPTVGATATVPPPAPPSLSAAWTAHTASFVLAEPKDEELEALVASAVRIAARESRADITVDTRDGLEILAGESRARIGVCNSKPQGGHLGKQVEALVQRAEQNGARVIMVRSDDFPPPTKSKVSETLGSVVKRGGAKVIVRGPEWRTIAALRAFVAQHEADAELDLWLGEERVASKLEVTRSILGELPARARAATPAPTPAPISTPNVAPPSPVSVKKASAVLSGQIFLGRTRSLRPDDVTRDSSTLMRHAAFLGGTGSGKTTLALNLIEQCLLQGVPALLVDRKGDLCRYGSDSFWNEVDPDPARAERKRALRERISVQVFTPGEHRGRPLALPVVPAGLGEMDESERSALATSAAAGLGAMMTYKSTSQPDTARLAILTKAIEILAQHSDANISLDHLINLIHDEDPTLVDAIGKLDPKHFGKLVEHLSTVKLRYETLLRGEERLDAELLFGLGAAAKPGKTALSIVSTKFLPDAGVIDFWVSRLLIELTRWSSRHPSPKLQALVMLDEADIYLPATSKPATKQPMQDLLRRARSAGVGVFLATQSPGDLDYKCRDNITTWFVGKIGEPRAVDKMKPLLSDYRANPATKLATAKTGDFFALAAGDVTELKAERSLMTTAQLSEDEIIAASRAL